MHCALTWLLPWAGWPGKALHVNDQAAKGEFIVSIFSFWDIPTPEIA